MQDFLPIVEYFDIALLLIWFEWKILIFLLPLGFLWGEFVHGMTLLKLTKVYYI